MLILYMYAMFCLIENMFLYQYLLASIVSVKFITYHAIKEKKMGTTLSYNYCSELLHCIGYIHA